MNKNLINGPRKVKKFRNNPLTPPRSETARKTLVEEWNQRFITDSDKGDVIKSVQVCDQSSKTPISSVLSVNKSFESFVETPPGNLSNPAFLSPKNGEDCKSHVCRF